MSKREMPKSEREEKKVEIIRKPSQLDKWLPLLAFVAVGILIFYPPYFRGLFFDKEVFITHIITAVIFIFIWINKIRNKDYTLLKTPLDWAIFLYAGAYLLSLFGAIHIGEAIYGFLKALNYFMVYWMVTNVVKNYQDYENILRILLASAVGVAAIGILAATGYSLYPSAFNGQYILSTLQYPNTTGAYLAVMSLIGITLWIREKNLAMKIIYSIATYLTMLVVLGTVSKGAWLIFALGILLLIIGMPGILKLKSIYTMGVSLGAAFITASKFMPAVTGKEPATGLPLVLIGVVIVLLGLGVWEGLIKLHQQKGTRPVIALTAGLIVIGVLALAFVMKDASQEVAVSSLKNEAKGITDVKSSSFTSRYDFVRWGMAIVKDHPVVGVGAGGWNALYHQYQDYLVWTTEVHNHFVQVWVEAGTIGMLVFLFMWIALIMALYKTFRARQKEQSGEAENWALIWGTATAALAFGAHTFIDFDLSLASMCFLLWTLFALINSSSNIEKIPDNSIFNLAPAANISIAAVLGLAMLLLGSSFTIAANYSSQGVEQVARASKIDNQQERIQVLNKAIDYFSRAGKFNKWNSSYQADLGRCNAIIFNEISQEKADRNDLRLYYDEAQKGIIQAGKLTPNDAKIRKALLQTCIIMGDGDGQTREAEAALKINPNDIHAYNNYAKIYTSYANYCLGKNDLLKAKDLLTKLSSLDERMDKQKQKINKERSWQGGKLELSPATAFAIAKSEFILGNYQEAASLLAPVVKESKADKNVAEQLNPAVWYAASLYRHGDKDKAESIAMELKQTNEQDYLFYSRLIRVAPLK